MIRMSGVIQALLKKAIYPQLFAHVGDWTDTHLGCYYFRMMGNSFTGASPKLFYTKDGEPNNRLIHNDHIKQLTTGIFLPDGLNSMAIDPIFSPTHFMVTISMGRNRILRRSFEFFGYEITFLHRQSIGPISLGKLPAGHFFEKFHHLNKNWCSRKEIVKLLSIGGVAQLVGERTVHTREVTGSIPVAATKGNFMIIIGLLIAVLASFILDFFLLSSRLLFI